MVVGKTSQYLPQLSTFENQTTGRLVFRQMHVVNFDALADAQMPVVAGVRPTVVTGFSANHLSAGLLLLRSISRAAFTAKERNASFSVSVVVWAMEEFRGKDRDDLRCVVKVGLHKAGKQTVSVKLDKRKKSIVSRVCTETSLNSVIYLECFKLAVSLPNLWTAN